MEEEKIIIDYDMIIAAKSGSMQALGYILDRHSDYINRVVYHIAPWCILSIGNPQNCHQNSLFLEREFLVFVRTRFLHSEVLSGASMHAASDNFSRRT